MAQQATMAYQGGGGLPTFSFGIFNNIHLWQIAQNPLIQFLPINSIERFVVNLTFNIQKIDQSGYLQKYNYFDNIYK